MPEAQPEPPELSKAAEDPKVRQAARAAQLQSFYDELDD